MAYLLRVAEVAAGATEVVVHEWGVDENRAFSTGDVVVTLETEKAVVDIEAEQDGLLVSKLVPAGAAVEVGAPIALLADPGEEVEDVEVELIRLGVSAPMSGMASAGESPAPAAEGGDRAVVGSWSRAPNDENIGEETEGHQGRIFSSPLARRLARDASLPLSEIEGTGPGGRIVKRDVQAAVQGRRAFSTEGASDVQEYVDTPHTAMRLRTASRLTESKQATPHFYLRASARVDGLLALRRTLVDAGLRVSLNDLVVKAVAQAHIAVPEMNVMWTPDAVRSFRTVDVALAVATDRGLVTPVLRGVDATSLSDLGAQSRDLIARARAGTLRQHELEGGTITVTNLGMFGIEEFAAIINPPQSAILAVGEARQQPVVDHGALAVGTLARLVLSADHRPVDGAVAAKWLQELVLRLEEPVRLIL